MPPRDRARGSARSRSGRSRGRGTVAASRGCGGCRGCRSGCCGRRRCGPGGRGRRPSARPILARPSSAGCTRRRRCGRRGGRGRPAGRRSAREPSPAMPCRMPPETEWSPPMATGRAPASAMRRKKALMRSIAGLVVVRLGQRHVAEVVDAAGVPGREAEGCVQPALERETLRTARGPRCWSRSVEPLPECVARRRGRCRSARDRGRPGSGRASQAPPVEALDHHPVVRREAAEVCHRGASVPSGRGGRARRPRRDGERQRERRLGLKSSTGLRSAAAAMRRAGGWARGTNTVGSCRSARGGVAAPDMERERANRWITVR